MFKYLAFIILAANTCNNSDASIEKNQTTSNSMIEKNMNAKATTNLHDIWALKQINGEDLNMDLFSQGEPVLEVFIADSRIGGFSGCNNYFASIEILTETEIKLGAIGATKKYCNNVDEQTYFQQLNKVTHYKIEKLHLYLFENENLLLTFRKVD